MVRGAPQQRSRLTLVAAVLVGLLIVVGAPVAVLVGHLGGDDGDAGRGSSSASGSTTTTAPSVSTEPSTEPVEVDLDAVYEMPETGDPVEFGSAYIEALLTYDTSRQSLDERRNALLAWTPPDGFFTDAEEMLDDFLGPEETWSAASRVDQSESAVIRDVWVPDSQKEELAADPKRAAQGRWPYVVTARVVRQVRGDVGANTDMPLTLSVIVSCPPDENCVAFAPGRSPVED